MPFELSWRPGGSVGFLFEFLGIFRLTMVVVKERNVVASNSYLDFFLISIDSNCVSLPMRGVLVF